MHCFDDAVCCQRLYIIINTHQNACQSHIKPTIYSEWRFSCACRAITISLKTPSHNRIFRRFGGFGRILCKNRSRVT